MVDYTGMTLNSSDALEGGSRPSLKRLAIIHPDELGELERLWYYSVKTGEPFIMRHRLRRADGHAERVAALHMIEPRADRPTAITLGADKAYDAEDFVNELRSIKVTAHVAQNTSGRSSAIDGRTTRHGRLCRQPAHPQAHRGGIRLDQDDRRAEKSRFRGRDRVGWVFTFAAAAYNLVRLPKLIAEAC
jgi:hypothetical protein